MSTIREQMIASGKIIPQGQMSDIQISWLRTVAARRGAETNRKVGDLSKTVNPNQLRFSHGKKSGLQISDELKSERHFFKVEAAACIKVCEWSDGAKRLYYNPRLNEFWYVVLGKFAEKCQIEAGIVDVIRRKFDAEINR